jgi:hypothetical protein
MSDLEKQLENTQRAFLQMQIENAQLKLTVLDLRKEAKEKDARLSNQTQGEV